MGSTSVRGGLRGWFGLRAVKWRETAVRVDPVLLGLVLAIVAVAVGTHAAYRENLRVRWASLYHDRNAHYQSGLSVACELRNGHVLRALLDLDAASLGWPVFHPLCLAAVLTVAGPLPSAAVLPSLFGWCGATVLAFLIVRRLAGDYGAAGGLITAALFLGSPALQALATDVMLESVGLCLTIGVIYAYLVFAERGTARAGCILGALLAVLFLHKYNYWGIAVIALSVTEFLRRPREVLGGIRAAFRMVPWSAWLAAQLRRPLNYIIIALLGITLAAVLNGGLYIETGGKRYGFKETRLFVNAAYVLLLVRLAVWWRSQGRSAAVSLGGEPFAALLVWAATPVLVWLALPFRLHYFVWYAGPGNNIGNVKRGPLDGLEYYFGGFVGEYHVIGVLAAIAAGLALCGLVALAWRAGGVNPPVTLPHRGVHTPRSPQSGWLVLPVAFVICGTLTVLHPNQQMRFLHTWGPLLWVLAGVGVAAVLRLLARGAGRTTAKVAAVGVVVGLSSTLIALTPAFAHISPAMGRGYGTPEASLRDLYDAYLPHLDGNEPTTILCNQPEAAWRWAFMEQFGHKNGLKSNLREAGVFDPVTADGVAKWLKSTSARTVVYIEIPPNSPLFEPSGVPADNSAIRGAMLSQTVFKLEQRIRVKNLGTVSIWKR